MLPIALGLLLMAPPPTRVPPQPPARFRGADAVARPLDRVLTADPAALARATPDAWCPTGDDFQRWLLERHRMAAPVEEPTLAKSHGDTPHVELNNNVVVMETDPKFLRYDRRPDVEGTSIAFLPQGDDYVVRRVPFIYEPSLGTQVLTNQQGYAAQPVDLTQMTFPFGGIARNRIWVTSTFTAAFADPPAPGPAQLHLGDLIADRLPRIAPLGQGTSLAGWNAWLREDSSEVLITWRAQQGGLDVDVQLALLADGSIRMTWQRLAGIEHGSPLVIDGDDAWWADRANGGITNDPADVVVPAPDGPAIDVVQVRGVQVGGSEILDVEVDDLAPLPAATDSPLEFAIEVRDEPGGPVLFTAWAEWEDGHFNWTNTAFELLPSGLRFALRRTELNLRDDDLELTVWTAQAWNWQQAVVANVAWPVPPQPLMRDISALTDGQVLRGPIAEAFTLPELDTYGVYDVFNRHFKNPTIDGLAIFQDFRTDIVFYAGAYSTVGNAGADGIGAGNTTDPLSPALLHMNTIREGWNSWDEGKRLVLNHEFGHHWLYFFQIMENGVPTRSLGDGHPAGWTATPAALEVVTSRDASCMGGSDWLDNADGTFTSSPQFASYGYSWHELYLMGLADPSEVVDWYYIRDSVPALPGSYWPDANLTVTGTRVDVTYQQIVDAMGPRVPAYPNTQRQFRVPMVLLVRPGEWAQADADEVARTCQLWRDNFNVETLGRASVTCDRVGDRPPAVAITEPPVDVTIVEGTTLSFTGLGDDPDDDPMTVAWTFAGLAPPAAGEGPHPVSFPDPGTYVITLAGQDSTGMSADPPATRTITVRCATPPEVPNLRVRHDHDVSLSFSWDALPPPVDEYVIGSTDVLRPAPVFAEALSGAQPLPMPMPAGSLLFFRVAGRNLPDCLGVW
jgi:hypothetical protein